MNENDIRHELQHILLGKSPVGQGTLIQAVASHLAGGTQAGGVAQAGQRDRHQEEGQLTRYADANGLWVDGIDFSRFISAGAEQRVFIHDERHVYKLNDAIYYANWSDYLCNLLLNNYFFPDTPYRLMGFFREGGVLYAVVEQPYVRADAPTDLASVKAFLAHNGFRNTRNHDYYHPVLGIILEDLHDENVLTQGGILYFIDTVFYIKPEIFWA